MTTEEIEFTDVVERVKAALAGAASSTGATFLPTETAEEIIELVYERNFMRSLLPAMPMSRRIVKVPKLTGSIDFHQQTLTNTESGDTPTESRQGTNEISLELKTMMANIPIGNYLVAYGVEGLLSVLREDIASRLAFNEANLFLNADTESTLANNIMGAYHASSNTGGISVTSGSEKNDYLLVFDGIRKSAAASDVTVSGTFALSHMRSAISNLGVYSDNREDLAFIVPRNLEVQLLGLTELQTVDKYGPAATILNGEVGRIYGIRVFATGVIPVNQAVDGTSDSGSSATFTSAIMTHVRSPIVGNSTVAERRFSIGFHDEPTKDRFVLIPKQDVAFAVRYGEAICEVVGINTV
jgi:hypothetical protein